MPTYEYQCDACQHNFDEFQSFSDKPLKKCPKCRKSKLRRVFGAGAAVIFKGSGFYQTDYRSDSYKSAAKAEQDGAKPSAGDKTATNGTPATSKTTEPANGAGGKESGKTGGKRSKSQSRVSDD
jgi:putative FmdB family regulatory protein